jgi:hypothetical protein
MKPKYIHIYDNGGKTVDRYTVVYTRTSSHEYVGLSERPFHPQGFCQHGVAQQSIDYPAYGHIGKKISWEDLPEDCKQIVMRDYEDIWGKGRFLV